MQLSSMGVVLFPLESKRFFFLPEIFAFKRLHAHGYMHVSLVSILQLGAMPVNMYLGLHEVK